MVHPELHMLHDTEGRLVCNVSFDLSADQLAASAHAVEAIRLERHRGEVLGTDDVLALREMTGLSDELHGLAERQAHATLLLTFARLVVLHDALADWAGAAHERGWQREEDQERLPLVDALLDPIASLRADALQAVLADGAHTAGC